MSKYADRVMDTATTTGAGKPPASATQGYRGLFAFWMGGAATYGSTPPPDPGIVDWIIRARRHCIR